MARGNINAVAAFMPPAYTQTALAAFRKRDGHAPPLPLFAYTAVGWWKGRFWVPGFRSDMDRRQDIAGFDQQKVTARTLKLLREKRHNRLIQHLGRCSLTYGCPAAKNFFLSRYEAPLSSSPVCNARCLGCLSLQTVDGPPAAQDRIAFTPTDREIAETALLHLRNVKRAIVSFGQGCEGEPLMQADLLASTVRRIRTGHRGGTINLNSNASLPAALERLIESGLDSIRISINSVFKDYYHAYYRPRGYALEQVLKSWELAREAGLHVSLNLFIMPGFTDSADHVERLSDLIGRLGLDLIQLRNHNIDPEWYLERIGFRPSGRILGIKGMVELLSKRFPGLRFGYFNPPLRD
jgi:pyruvate-formate lyase-activating enzyme